MSWNEDLNVLALSEVMAAGSPLQLVNLRKASEEDSTLRAGVSSKCTVWVDTHMNRQT